MVEWLHRGCDSDLSADFLNFGAGDFPFKFLLKSASQSCFFALARRSGFGAAILFSLCTRKFLCVKPLCVKACFCASFVVQSSTGKCFVQALQCKDVFCAIFVEQSSTAEYFVQAL